MSRFVALGRRGIADRHLDGAGARFPGSVITVRSVLDMHSGIPGDINNGSVTAGRPYPGYDRFLLRILAKEYPERPVNTAYARSNSGYALLQNLVQNVTGQNFATYTCEHLFGPMGMASTTLNDASVPDSELTRGYQAVTALWIRPATIAGRRLLLVDVNDSSSGPAPDDIVPTLAEKIPSSYRIPQAWQARTGSPGDALTSAGNTLTILGTTYRRVETGMEP